MAVSGMRIQFGSGILPDCHQHLVGRTSSHHLAWKYGTVMSNHHRRRIAVPDMHGHTYKVPAVLPKRIPVHAITHDRLP